MLQAEFVVGSHILDCFLDHPTDECLKLVCFFDRDIPVLALEVAFQLAYLALKLDFLCFSVCQLLFKLFKLLVLAFPFGRGLGRCLLSRCAEKLSDGTQFEF